MSRLQFARKPAQSAERNLRLVPPPRKGRRPRLKIGRILRPKYDNNHALHAYEHEIVLAAMRAHGGVVSVNTLCSQEPGRWNAKTLQVALVRMAKAKLIEGSGTRGLGAFGRSLTYRLKEED